jgi:broad specificity phosphatase PhoE
MQPDFVRHGDSKANVRQLFSNSDRDPAFGLTDVGRGQVEGLAWRRYYAVREAWFRDKDWTARIEGRESFEDIRARFIPCVEALLASPPPGPVLLLGHAGTFQLHAANHRVERHPSTWSSSTGWTTRVS